MKMVRIIKRLFSISFSIYFIGTLGGILMCFLEALRRIQFHNYENLPLWEGKLILASTHPSWLDVVIVPLLYFPWWFREILKRSKDFFILPIRVIEKKPLGDIFTEDFKDIPVSMADKYNLRSFRWLLEDLALFINREEDKITARSTLLRRAIEILKDNRRIVIFPGGGRDFRAEQYDDGIYDIKTRRLILRMPKPGIGQMVKSTGAPIVPIRLEGTDKVLPNQYNERLPSFLKWTRYLLRVWHPVIIKIGKPIRLPKGTDEKVVLQEYINAQIVLFYEGR